MGDHKIKALLHWVSLIAILASTIMSEIKIKRMITGVFKDDAEHFHHGSLHRDFRLVE